MKVMVLVRADKASEAGRLPDEKFMAAMTKYNEEQGCTLAPRASASDSRDPSVQ